VLVYVYMCVSHLVSRVINLIVIVLQAFVYLLVRGCTKVCVCRCGGEGYTGRGSVDT
jgi:hypothetical protein